MHEERVAVGLGLSDASGAERTARAAHVLDDDLLTQVRDIDSADQPGHRIGWAAGRERHDNRDRTRWVVLRRSSAKSEGQSGDDGTSTNPAHA